MRVAEVGTLVVGACEPDSAAVTWPYSTLYMRGLVRKMASCLKGKDQQVSLLGDVNTNVRKKEALSYSISRSGTSSEYQRYG